MCVGWSWLASSISSLRAHLVPKMWSVGRRWAGGGVTGLRLLLLMEDSRPGSVGRPTHTYTVGSQANMTIEETMLRQTEFYNLNASMQEQSKVRELRNVRFELCWSWQSQPSELFPGLIPLLTLRSFYRLNTSTLSLTNSVGSVMNPLLASTSEPSPARAANLSLVGLVTIRLVVSSWW